MPDTLDLNKIDKIHFTGIKGVGMTGLAIIAKQIGKQVTGSDVAEEFITDEVLVKNEIEPQVGFAAERIKNVDLVIVSGAHGGKTNIEPQAALKLGKPVLMHAEALGLFSQGKKVIAVAGCHGKTTTSAMIAWILKQADVNPSFAVGTSEITGLGFAAASALGDYFVIEADEYMTCPQTDRTPRFLYLAPYLTVVTNIEHDHPDRYQDIDETKDAFLQLIQKTHPDGLIVACIDNEHVRDLVSQNTFAARVITYGQSQQADWQICDIKSKEGFVSWNLRCQSSGVSCQVLEASSKKETTKWCLQIPGEHNVFNASAAAIAAREVGVPLSKSCGHLCGFQGLKRRFEFVGEKNGIKIYDDYAHHPTELKATLKAAREWFPTRRIVAIFQPHTFSRTKVLFDEFCTAFADADIVILPDIFPSAREKEDFGMTSELLASAISKKHNDIFYIPRKEDVVDWLGKNAKEGDVVFTIGAGDVYQIGNIFLEL